MSIHTLAIVRLICSSCMASFLSVSHRDPCVQLVQVHSDAALTHSGADEHRRSVGGSGQAPLQFGLRMMADGALRTVVRSVASFGFHHGRTPVFSHSQRGASDCAVNVRLTRSLRQPALMRLAAGGREAQERAMIIHHARGHHCSCVCGITRAGKCRLLYILLSRSAPCDTLATPAFLSCARSRRCAPPVSSKRLRSFRLAQRRRHGNLNRSSSSAAS